MRWAMVPSAPFRDVPMPAGADYGQARLWIARPDIAGNPSLWTAAGRRSRRAAPRASVFFIHPTSFLESTAWNAPINDPESQDRAALFVRSQASAFNSVGADLGAEISAGDVRRLPDQRGRCAGARSISPIATCSPPMRSSCARRRRTGRSSSPRTARAAPHLMRLLAGADPRRARGAADGRRLSDRLAGLDDRRPARPSPSPPASSPDQARCVLSWQSFAEPADPSQITDVYDESAGPGGAGAAGTAMLCTNPLTGARGGAAPAPRQSRHPGPQCRHDRRPSSGRGAVAGALRPARLPADRRQ